MAHLSDLLEYDPDDLAPLLPDTSIPEFVPSSARAARSPRAALREQPLQRR